MKLRKRLIASLLALTLVVPLFSAAATKGTVEAAANTITQTSKEVYDDICAETNEKYAVLSGNVKVNAALNRYENVQFFVTPEHEKGFSSFQVLWHNDEKGWYVKVADGTNNLQTEDGVILDQHQSFNESPLPNITTEVGLDFKIVRLNDWAYFLVKDTDGGYKLVGRMNGLKDKYTKFSLSNDVIDAEGEQVVLSDYTVTTGKEEALAALAGSKFSVKDTSGDLSDVKDSVYFPVDSTIWTLQARVSLPNYDTIAASTVENRAAHVGPGAGSYNYSWKYGMGIVKQSSGWKIQNLAIWDEYTFGTNYADKLKPANGGMWIRWVRSGNELSVYISEDGATWTYALGRHDLATEESANGIYINAANETNLTDIKITLKGNITQTKGQSNDLCTETTDKYAVLSGNVKMNANAFDAYKNVQFFVTSEQGEFSQFQLLSLQSEANWTVKVPDGRNSNDSNANEDGVKVVQHQSLYDPLLANVKGTSGIDFKIVRLDSWAYFLVRDTDGGYKLVGRMYGLKDRNTKFTMSNGDLVDGETVVLSDYTVTTGKEEAIAALAGSKFSVEDTSGGNDIVNVDNSVYFPVESTEWTVQARVSLPNYDTIAASAEENRAAHVGPGAGSFNYYSWNRGMGIVKQSSGWKIQNLNEWSEYTFGTNYADKLNPANGGMWIRWVRSGSKLSVYISEDGATWTYALGRNDLAIEDSANGIYIDAANKTDFTDIKITLAKAKVVGAQASVGDKITMNFFMSFTDEILADPAAKVEYTLPDEKNTAGSVLVKDLTTDTYNGVSYKVFSCDVAAKEMASDIKFKVVAGDGTFGKEFNYKVQTYAEAIINGDYTADEKTMAKAMLNYGGYAQQYFGFNAENLANKGIDSTLADVDLSTISDATVNTPEGLNYYGTSLMTTSATAIRHYFTLAEGKSINDYTFKYGENTLDPVAKSAYYYVEISGITAAQLGDSFTLTINDANTLTYSPYTYVKAVLNGTYDAKLQNLAKAIYHYGQAADALKKNNIQ